VSKVTEEDDDDDDDDSCGMEYADRMPSLENKPKNSITKHMNKIDKASMKM